MKKLEDQESAVNVACPMEDEASWVITCKSDHEEEITQFDGETEEDDDQRDFHVPEHYWQREYVTRRIRLGGNKDRVTCTDEIPNTVLSRMLLCQFRRFGRNDHIPEIPDHIDELVTVMPKVFGGRKLGSTTKDGSDLGDEDEKNKLEELKVIIVTGGDAEYIKKS